MVCLLQKGKRQTPLARSLANPIQFFPKIAFLVPAPEKCLSLLETHAHAATSLGKDTQTHILKVVCVALLEDLGCWHRHLSWMNVKSSWLVLLE